MHDFHTEMTEYDPAYVASKYRYTEEGTGRLYRLDIMVPAQPRETLTTR